MTDTDDEFTYAEMLEKVRALPPMTAEQRIEQRISFAWGNAAIEWPTPPPLTLEAFTAQTWKAEWRKLRAALEAIRAVATDVLLHQIVEEALK